jgi:hypothetical protein
MGYYGDVTVLGYDGRCGVLCRIPDDTSNRDWTRKATEIQMEESQKAKNDLSEILCPVTHRTESQVQVRSEETEKKTKEFNISLVQLTRTTYRTSVHEYNREPASCTEQRSNPGIV